MDVNKDRETKYYLYDNKLFELVVNFQQMTMNLYELDRNLATEDKPIAHNMVFGNSLTASNYTNYIDLTELERFRMVRTSMSLARQVINYNISKKEEKVVVSTFDDYENAYTKWKEKLVETEKAEKVISECTLESIILPDDVKEDILSTINFVKNIDKYLAMGCEIPAGILLEGPPGTGKTLIAKTIATETNMNFKSLVASDLVQKYVGDSAKRIQKEFDDLTKEGGGILFIDEIDAIGQQRSSSDENKEYRAALNKLLACMSEANEKNIIVICATNIKDQLDPALIREGRIDKIINVPLPNEENREKLFKLYVGKLQHDDDIDYKELAKKTKDKSGAFIAACCNHSGIYAVDKGSDKTCYEHITHTLDKMLNKREEKEDHSIGFV